MADVTLPQSSDVELVVAELTDMPDDLFLRTVSDIVMDRQAGQWAGRAVSKDDEISALRSRRLAKRSLAALGTIVEDADARLQRVSPADKTRVAQLQHFRNRVRYEQRIVHTLILDRGDALRPNEPNPKARAMERLWNMALRGDAIDRHTPARLVAEERARLDAVMKAEKERRKAERKREPLLSPSSTSSRSGDEAPRPRN